MANDDPNNSPGEAQYRKFIGRIKAEGATKLGLMTSWGWSDDPKRLAFTLARYKFVAKMLAGRNAALEVGCGDGFATRIVGQAVPKVVAVDFDPSFVEDAKARSDGTLQIEYRLHDILSGPVEGCFDAVYSLDVLEHIAAGSERIYMTNVCASLEDKGVVVIGMPSLESQPYASEQSREGHVNCKTQEDFRALMLRHFDFVFMFSMNDEVVHTGFGKMSHYHLALCCGKK